MQAVQVTAFGDPTVLSLAELPEPTPGPGEISIDVTHAAVGLIDLFFRRGAFKDQPGMPQPPFVPGLEVAGTVRALGQGVTGFEPGEQVVSMARNGTGGYASVFVANAALVVSIEGTGIDPALAVSMIPNAAMAHISLTDVAHLQAGESVLVHGAFGGLASAFPGIARQLRASRIVGTVRAGKLAAAADTMLPYDRIVDAAKLVEELGDEKFDVVVDPVGGELRSQSLALMRPGGRLLAVGNASEDWSHAVIDSQLWLGSVAIIGFNAGAYIPTHPETVQPALEAARTATAAGLENIVIETMPFSQAAAAHRRVEDRILAGRIVLTTEA